MKIASHYGGDNALMIDPPISTMIQREFWYPKVGNFEWRLFLKIFRDGHRGKNLSICIECHPDDKLTNLWSFDAEIEFILKSKKKGKQTTLKVERSFKRKSTKFRVRRTLKNSLFNNEEISTISVSLSINILVKSLIGIELMQIIDFSKPRNIDSEVVLLVENERLYVDKYPLIFSSSVFREMISNNDGNEIEIKYADLRGFKNFLLYLCRQEQKINEENVESLLRLANRFNVQFLLSETEDYLCSTECKAISLNLLIADQYNFTRLQEETFKQLSKNDFKYLMEAKSWQSLTIGTKARSMKLGGIDTATYFDKETLSFL